jgi:histidine kinase/DNA gyrase B/HSP90-like ATPase
LPPTAGQNLFNRFVRSLQDETEQSGVGLGLWLVKSIVERHGGRVDAQSTQTGTCMRSVLPRELIVVCGAKCARMAVQPAKYCISHRDFLNYTCSVVLPVPRAQAAAFLCRVASVSAILARFAVTIPQPTHRPIPSSP